MLKRSPHPRQALATATSANAAESAPASSGTLVAEGSGMCPSRKASSFDTRSQAWRDIDGRGKRGKHLTPYPCPHCGKFHLTSRVTKHRGGAR